MDTITRFKPKPANSLKRAPSPAKSSLAPVLGAALALSPAGGALASSLADFNRDGKLDLLTQRVGSDPPYPVIVGVHLGRGDGTFRPSLELPTRINTEYEWRDWYAAVEVTDLNRDGKLDLVMAVGAYDCSKGCDIAGLGATTLLGNGNGTFRAGSDFDISGYPAAMQVADVNRDGTPDLLSVGYAGGDYCYSDWIGIDATWSVRLGRGNGTFSPAAVLETIGYGGSCEESLPLSQTIGDFNRDGKLDVMMGAGVRLGVGDGTFHPPSSGSPTDGESADLNRDGKPDVLTSSGVRLGNGNGTFKPPLVGSPTGGSLADLNRDGRLDVVTPEGVRLGNGNGTFRPPLPGSPTGGELGDLNRDGHLDILTYEGVRLGNCDGSFQPPLPDSPTRGWLADLMADLNRDGKLDLLTQQLSSDPGYPVIVSVHLGRGDGTFQPPLQVVSLHRMTPRRGSIRLDSWVRD